MPIENNSETPLAGERLEAIVATLLRARGVARVDHAPPPTDPDAAVTMSDRQRSDAALEWARRHGYVYAVAGSVEEWRHKSGLDGEPAIGLSLRIVRIEDDTVVWSGTTSRTGWTHESVSSTALRAVNVLIDDLTLSP